MSKVVIASAVRTAIGKFGGTLKDIRAPTLGSYVIKETIERSGLSNEDINEVIMGNVVSAGLGQNPARQAMLTADLPDSIPAFTVNTLSSLAEVLATSLCGRQSRHLRLPCTHQTGPPQSRYT